MDNPINLKQIETLFSVESFSKRLEEASLLAKTCELINSLPPNKQFMLFGKNQHGKSTLLNQIGLFTKSTSISGSNFTPILRSNASGSSTKEVEGVSFDMYSIIDSRGVLESNSNIDSALEQTTRDLMSIHPDGVLFPIPINAFKEIQSGANEVELVLEELVKVIQILKSKNSTVKIFHICLIVTFGDKFDDLLTMKFVELIKEKVSRWFAVFRENLKKFEEELKKLEETLKNLNDSIVPKTVVINNELNVDPDCTSQPQGFLFKLTRWFKNSSDEYETETYQVIEPENESTKVVTTEELPSVQENIIIVETRITQLTNNITRMKLFLDNTDEDYKIQQVYKELLCDCDIIAMKEELSKQVKLQVMQNANFIKMMKKFELMDGNGSLKENIHLFSTATLPYTKEYESQLKSWGFEEMIQFMMICPISSPLKRAKIQSIECKKLQAELIKKFFKKLISSISEKEQLYPSYDHPTIIFKELLKTLEQIRLNEFPCFNFENAWEFISTCDRMMNSNRNYQDALYWRSWADCVEFIPLLDYFPLKWLRNKKLLSYENVDFIVDWTTGFYLGEIPRERLPSFVLEQLESRRNAQDSNESEVEPSRKKVKQ